MSQVPKATFLLLPLDDRLAATPQILSEFSDTALTTPLPEATQAPEKCRTAQPYQLPFLDGIQLKIFSYNEITTLNNKKEPKADFVQRLADAFANLPATLKLRAVMQMKPSGEVKCWLMVQSSNGTFPLCELQDVLGLTPADDSNLIDELQQITVQGVTVVRIQEGTIITEPGMTRNLTNWLVKRGHITYMICDFVPKQSSGLASIELTYVFNGDSSVRHAFSHEVGNVMDAEATAYSPSKAQQFIQKVQHHLWGRPRMVVTVGNAADIWPTVFEWPIANFSGW